VIAAYTGAQLAQLADLVRLLVMLNAELARLLHLLPLLSRPGAGLTFPAVGDFTARPVLHPVLHPVPSPALGGMALCWTALRLDEVRTDVLAGLDLRRGPWQAVRQVRRELAARRDEHEILPAPGTVRRERDGAPAALTDPQAYPVVAVCDCGRPVRCEAWFRAPWLHTDETGD
jgi:hypothetical protein